MSCPTCSSREKATQDLVRLIQTHVDVADQQGRNSFHASVVWRLWFCLTTSCPSPWQFLPSPAANTGFLQGSAMGLSFIFVILCKGYLIYFHTSADDSEMSLIIIPRSQITLISLSQVILPNFFTFLSSWPNSAFLGLPTPPPWRRIWCKAPILRELIAQYKYMYKAHTFTVCKRLAHRIMGVQKREQLCMQGGDQRMFLQERMWHRYWRRVGPRNAII